MVSKMGFCLHQSEPLGARTGPTPHFPPAKPTVKMIQFPGELVIGQKDGWALKTNMETLAKGPLGKMWDDK